MPTKFSQEEYLVWILSFLQNIFLKQQIKEAPAITSNRYYSSLAFIFLGWQSPIVIPKKIKFKLVNSTNKVSLKVLEE